MVLSKTVLKLSLKHRSLTTMGLFFSGLQYSYFRMHMSPVELHTGCVLNYMVYPPNIECVTHSLFCFSITPSSTSTYILDSCTHRKLNGFNLYTAAWLCCCCSSPIPNSKKCEKTFITSSTIVATV